MKESYENLRLECEDALSGQDSRCPVLMSADDYLNLRRLCMVHLCDVEFDYMTQMGVLKHGLVATWEGRRVFIKKGVEGMHPYPEGLEVVI